MACIFNHSTGGTGDFVSSNFTIHDFPNALWHNGAARTVTAATSIPTSSASFTVVSEPNDPGCVTMSAFVNRTITRVGTGAGSLQAFTFVTSVSGCTLTLNRVTGPAIPAGTQFKIENSNVRSVDDAVVNSSTPNITSNEANFAASDLGCSIEGTNFADGGGALGTIAPGTATTANTTPGPVAYPSFPLPSAAPHPTVVVTICGSKITATTRRTVDPLASSTSSTITSSKVKWSTDDIGMPVYGPGLPSSTPTNPCTVKTFSANTATLSSTCASGGITDFIVGDPSYTAPANGEVVLNLADELPLDPNLVQGPQATHDCSEDEAKGYDIEGQWMNPGLGSYSAPDGLFLNDQPAGTKTIAQILFKTAFASAITGGGAAAPLGFAAYVVEASPNQDATSVGARHYDIEFPGAPTTVALCASTATSPGLGMSIGVNAGTISQNALTIGFGRPGTTQVRSTTAATNASTTSTVFITDDLTDGTFTAGGGVKWLNSDPNFNRLCLVPAGKPDISPPNGFVCGDG